jgi:hypothetical protein
VQPNRRRPPAHCPHSPHSSSYVTRTHYRFDGVADLSQYCTVCASNYYIHIPCRAHPPNNLDTHSTSPPSPLLFSTLAGGCWTARAPLVGSVRGAGCASKRDVTVRPFSHGHCRVHQVTAIGWGEVVQGHQCQEEQGVQAPHPVGQAPPSPALVDFARVGCHILLSLTDCSAHRTFSSVHYLIYLHTHLLALACKLRWKCKNCIPSF